MKTALLVIACVVLTAQPCAAEWFGDVYAGASFTNKRDVTVHASTTGLTKYRDVESDTGLAFGLRFGRYFDAVPFLGLGVDVFNFYSDIGPQTVRADGCVISGACGTSKIGFGSYETLNGTSSNRLPYTNRTCADCALGTTTSSGRGVARTSRLVNPGETPKRPSMTWISDPETRQPPLFL